MGIPWFRMWAEFKDDPLVRGMSDEMQIRLVRLFCLRCAGPTETMSEEQIAFALGCNVSETFQETKKVFLANHFIRKDWGVLHWDKRQYASDSSTARVQKHREIKHSTDPRHIACKEEIFSYYQRANIEADPDWDGREGRALGMFLSANPKLTAAGVKRLLDHRARSEVNHADRPALWIPTLTRYRNGPIDRFGQPLNLSTIGASNGHYASKGERNQQALADYLSELEQGINQSGDSAPGDDNQIGPDDIQQAARGRG